MAIPKAIDDKISLMALKEAANSDFDDPDEDEPELPKFKCPECGCQGLQEDFQEVDTEEVDGPRRYQTSVSRA